MIENYYTSLKNKKILITGASSGIGKACAELCSELGAELFLVARREDRLIKLQKKLKTKVSILAGDINSKAFVQRLVQNHFTNVDAVINNAGLAIGKDPAHLLKDDDIDMMLSTNVGSAIKIAQRCLKNMLLNGQGDIINICSIASHDSYAGGSVYCPTKHALLSFGKVIREETYGQNIRVMSVSPGMVETEFSEVRFNGDKEKAQAAYQGMTPLSPQDIAFQIAHALRLPRHINLDEIIILATDQAGATKVLRK